MATLIDKKIIIVFIFQLNIYIEIKYKQYVQYSTKYLAMLYGK